MSSSLETNWANRLFTDPAIERLFSDEQQFAHYLAFETALAKAMADNGLLDQALVERTVSACKGFRHDPVAIESAMERDGLPVPELVRQLKAFVGQECATVLHIGTTSQDLIDTAGSLTLRTANELYQARLQGLTNSLNRLLERDGQRNLMGRTRMQAALPITAGDRIRSWLEPLQALQVRLADLRADVEVVQLGGPVGTRDGFGDKAAEVSASLAAQLGLRDPKTSWHSQRGRIVDFANWLSMVSGTLGKMGMDIALMAQQGTEEIVLRGGGSSSAMPHKQNPVQAEMLVTIARFNAAQISALHHALVHEQERSGAAWGLEWITLPKMASTGGRAMLIAEQLLAATERIGN